MPFILAMDPVGSAITFPHDLHVTVLVTCEYRTFSALHSLHCTFWNLLLGFGIRMCPFFNLLPTRVFLV